MSRLSSLSPAALRALFSPDADDTLITLLTITPIDLASGEEPFYIADNWISRLSETTDNVVYGVTSRGNDYSFLPLNITLPTEEHAAAPRCTVTLHDIGQQLIPAFRQLTGPPEVLLELVLRSTPDTVEASFGGFKIANIKYNATTITVDLVVESLAVEPFPQHTFVPSIFPGLF